MPTNLFLTLMIAFVVIVFAIACLAVGWLITGRKAGKICCGGSDKQPEGNDNKEETPR